MKKRVLLGIVLAVSALSSVQGLESVATGAAATETQLNMRLSVAESSIRAQLEQIEKYIDAAEACQKKGLIYGPDRSGADAGGCSRGAEQDIKVSNWAFDQDTQNNNNVRPDTGMDVCAQDEFVTANGKRSVACSGIHASTPPAVGSCAPRSITVGHCIYALGEMQNGQKITKRCERCDAQKKEAFQESVEITCQNGLFVEKSLGTKECRWGTSSDTCSYAASCKPGTDTCKGKIAIRYATTSCSVAASMQHAQTNVYSCNPRANVRLSQNIECVHGTFVPKGDSVVTSYCLASKDTLENPKNKSQKCQVQNQKGSIGSTSPASCTLPEGGQLSAQYSCNYSVGPEVDTSWKRSGDIVYVAGENACAATSARLTAFESSASGEGAYCYINIPKLGHNKSRGLSCSSLGAPGVVQGSAKCLNGKLTVSKGKFIASRKGCSNNAYVLNAVYGSNLALAPRCTVAVDLADKASKSVSCSAKGQGSMSHVKGTITAKLSCDNGAITASNKVFKEDAPQFDCMSGLVDTGDFTQGAHRQVSCAVTARKGKNGDSYQAYGDAICDNMLATDTSCSAKLTCVKGKGWRMSNIKIDCGRDNGHGGFGGSFGSGGF